MTAFPKPEGLEMTSRPFDNVTTGRTTFPKPEGRVRDAEYLRRVRLLPCLLIRVGGCYGPIESDHAGERPVGRRASDRSCLPMCSAHHRARTDYAGYFYGWDGVLMRAFCDHWIAVTQEMVDRGVGTDDSQETP